MHAHKCVRFMVKIGENSLNTAVCIKLVNKP